MDILKKLFLPLLLCLALTACGAAGEVPKGETPADVPAVTEPEEPAAPVAPEEPKFDLASATLVPWDGVVEHLFFHPIVAYPERAFDSDNNANGIDDWMLTVDEYDKILESLYANGYVLIDINRVWSEQTAADGTVRMVRNTLQIPEGKKPLILSYDDVNYYAYMLRDGFTHKLVIGENGQLWSWGKDPTGKEVLSQDLDAVTILDKFVRAHPDFSPYGDRGCLSLTGYEGILGYRTMTEKEDSSAEHEANRQREIEAVKPIIAELKRCGWTFGSHSWGHINLANKPLATVQADSEKWKNEVGALVGESSIFFYPHGARPDGDDVKTTGPIFKYLQAQGFRVFCSVGIDSYSQIKKDISAVICDRLHPDGTTLRHSRDRYLRFYDAKNVMNVAARPQREIDW